MSGRGTFLTLAVPVVHKEIGKTGFKYFSTYKWNKLPKRYEAVFSDFNTTF